MTTTPHHAALVALLLAAPAWGQGMSHDMSGVQGESPPPGRPKAGLLPPGGTGAQRQGCSTCPPPDARDPHAYSGGQDFGPLGRPKMGDEHHYGAFLADHLEAAQGRDNSEFAYDLQAWYGGTYDRAVLKAEGGVDAGRLQEARSELLWSHAVAGYWDLQAGLRVDHGEGPQRNWLALGVQGLAPYWFEVDVAAYLGEHGRTALRAEAEYELLLTQRLILQPRIEANLYGKRDAAREIGSGLSDLVAGLRLRYEITRQFAPYLGVEWAANYGDTADFAREAGERTRDTRWVAGLRLWF